MSDPGAPSAPAGAGRSDLVARDLEVFWHPCTQMRDHRSLPPLEVVRARGCRLELADGRTLLDAISSWWCKSLGHGHPRLTAALTGQLAAFEHVMTAGFTHAPLVRLCERLLAAASGLPVSAWGGPSAPDAPGAPDAPAAARATPTHFRRVFLAENGSTGVEIALKMALQAQAQRGQPGRTRFAALANGYHGETIGALSVGDLGLYADPFRALTFPVTRLGPLPYRAGPHDPRWMDPEPEWSQLESVLEPVASTLAGIIYEPVLQAAGGMQLYSPALLARLARWARERGVYLIADEIAAGMGRLGGLLATHLACPGPDPSPDVLPDVLPGALPDVLPDLAVLSKGLTGGVLPLSAVLTTEAIYQLFDADHLERRAFLHSNTYAGHALAVAVAGAVLDVFAAEAILPAARQRGTHLFQEMSELAARRPFLRGLRGAGMMAAVDLRKPDGQPLDPRHRTGYQVYAAALERGALLRPIGDTMYLLPPLNTAPADLTAMVSALADSMDAVLSRG